MSLSAFRQLPAHRLEPRARATVHHAVADPDYHAAEDF